jgi:thioredoxin reductase (NADPH)
MNDMAEPKSSTIETRFDQMFPRLTPAEIDRLRPFGETRTYDTDERLVTSGEVSPGMFVVLRGEVAVSQHNVLGHSEPIVTHPPGSFMGELAQLSGRPALVDARATKPVEAIVIPSDRLRDVLVAEADLGERIMRALILRRVGLLETGISGPVLLGRAEHPDTLRLAQFLRRSGHPHKVLSPDTDSCATTVIEHFHLDTSKLPVVICPNGQTLHNPTEAELAACMGLVRPIDPDKVFDVVIVGAGPAGLAAAVYGASEGLSVLALDCRAFGGQAGASARIENYLGFPTGITGLALMARAYNQAQKFGAEMAIPDEVVRLQCHSSGDGDRFQVGLANGEHVRARAVVIASGATYRRLPLGNLTEFEGGSVHYWASPSEAKLCAGQEIALVGAGNSAGQAVVYLASQVAKVWLMTRRASLDATMSRYLVDRIRGLPNVEVLPETTVCKLEGAHGALEAIHWKGPAGETTRPIRHLFSFIGADPNTSWLSASDVALDEKGFIRTGSDVALGRRPLETSRDGIFAIGDVRAGSTKRCAAAVGEGAQVISTIHAHLADPGDPLAKAERGRI